MENAALQASEPLLPAQENRGLVEGNASEPEAAEKPRRKRAPRKKKPGVSKGIKFRLYPDEEQQSHLRRWTGASRWVWNFALARQNEHYRATGQHLSSDEVSKELTLLMKQDPELAWLQLLPRTCITRTLAHLGRAWKAFFDGLSGKRKDKPGQPKFRARGSRQEALAFQVDPRIRNPVDEEGCLLRVPVLGYIPFKASEPVPGKPVFITIQCKGGEWEAALTLTEVEPSLVIRKPEKTKVFEDPLDPAGLVGLDASVRNSAVASSDGKTVHRLLDDKAKACLEKKEQGKKRHQRQFSHKVVCQKRDAKQLRKKQSKKPRRTRSWWSCETPGHENYNPHASRPRPEPKPHPKPEPPEDKKVANEKGGRNPKTNRKAKGKAKAAVSGRAKRKAKSQRRAAKRALSPEASLARQERLKLSRRAEKARRMAARQNLRIRRFMQDIIHKFTTELVRNHHTIVVETLVLHAMAQSLSRGFRRNMHRACMGEIIRQLKYKCAWHGRTLVFVDQWFPSSKRCSNPACHQVYAGLTLSETQWTCSHCLTFHERDDNAAFNLWQEGWRLLHLQASKTCSKTVGSTGSARGVSASGGVSQSLKAGASKRESSRKTLALQAPAPGMEPVAGAVG